MFGCIDVWMYRCLDVSMFAESLPVSLAVQAYDLGEIGKDGETAEAGDDEVKTRS